MSRTTSRAVTFAQAAGGQSKTQNTYDALIVGGGPVGLSLGIYLAHLGHRTLVVETTNLQKQTAQPVTLSGESQRLLAHKIGLGEAWVESTTPSRKTSAPHGRLRFVTEFPGPKRLDAEPNEPIDDPLSGETKHEPGPSGFNDANFFQPELMKRLLARAAELPNLDVRLDTRLLDFHETQDARGRTMVHAVCRPTETEWMQLKSGEWLARDVSHGNPADMYNFFCRYIVGCDGKNSRVREIITAQLGVEELAMKAEESMNDLEAAIDEQGGEDSGLEAAVRGHRMVLNYADTRVVIDVEVLKEDIVGKKLSSQALHVCSGNFPVAIMPGARVTADGGGGGRHWRFEIVVTEDAGKAAELIKDEAAVYKLLSPYVTKEDVKIIGSAIQRPFAAQSLVWLRGRAVLAGSSAHSIPPWLGQRLNQGFQDVWNLAWKLDLCIRGLAPEGLLESYEAERKPNNAQHLVASCRYGLSVLGLSQIAVETKGDFAAFKKGFDEVFKALRKHPFEIQNNYQCKYSRLVLPTNMVSEDQLGRVLAQPMQVDTGKGKVALDSLIGDGYALLTACELQLSHTSMSKLLGARGMHFKVPAAVLPQLGGLFDNGVVAALVRPDHVVCATAKDASEIETIMAALTTQLGSRRFDDRLGRAFIVGTGCAFGNHYTTEQMKGFFKQQREKDPNMQEMEIPFANKLLDACSFDFHSVCLPPQDVFRRFSRSEYLEHRMTALHDLALRACEDALKLWGGRREDITHFYWGTMTGGMHAPTLDIRLTKALGLNLDVARVSIEGMGCLTGYRCMNLAREAASADPNARILVIEGELRSALGNSLPETVTKGDIVSSGLFRDAASSCVISGVAIREDEKVYYEMACGLSRIVAETNYCVDYRELDCGGIRLYLDKKLPYCVADGVPSFATKLIEKAKAAGFNCPPLAEMDIACHTGGPRLLQMVIDAAGVDTQAVASTWAVMRGNGNLSGASNLAVLDHHNHGCMAEEKDEKWVFCLSMGPGMCLEGALLKRISPVDSDKASAAGGPGSASKRQGVQTARAGLRKTTFKELATQIEEVAPDNSFG